VINFWKLSYEAVKKQRDQLKQETEKLCERNKELEKRCNQKVRRYLRGGLQQRRIVDLESKYNAMKTQRDSLIDDIAVIRANNERLERENEKLRNESIKNYKLWEESEEQERYFVKEFNKYHNLYTTLTNHIRDIRSDMMKLYENYEEQKSINKDVGIHKILEGSQISLSIMLDELGRIYELERADDER
jgi:chromosome segregation ATPase